MSDFPEYWNQYWRMQSAQFARKAMQVMKIKQVRVHDFRGAVDRPRIVEIKPGRAADPTSALPVLLDHAHLLYLGSGMAGIIPWPVQISHQDSSLFGAVADWPVINACNYLQKQGIPVFCEDAVPVAEEPLLSHAATPVYLVYVTMLMVIERFSEPMPDGSGGKVLNLYIHDISSGEADEEDSEDSAAYAEVAAMLED